ncbi:adenylosuccinate synthetase [Cedratvirus kamchatka]|uniref:Adenylosuccinate synthetase n=1 Tax=Cedratvirus kamchatka TaxID=2716914 RepID=A0A6G8MYM4_9VIRU|nr:adenylosuccinate synthetase [Cedratvirus kamchatka]
MNLSDLPVTAVIGTFFGDEGKGKLVDYLASTQNFSVIARSAGGSNSAHTISHQGQTYTSHLVPSGILACDALCLLGNGMVIDLAFLLEECKNIESRFGVSCLSRLRISDRAHLVFPFHKKVDYLQDRKTGVKTTCQGIGPAYSDKISRRGIRMGTLRDKNKFTLAYWKLVDYHRNIFPELSGFDFQAILDLHLGQYRDVFLPLLVDSCSLLHRELDQNKNILVECSQACMLDIDHGFYPFVTSSSTCVGGVVSGLGLPPQKISTIGVIKAIVTRVTSPSRLPTQFTDEEKKEILSWFSPDSLPVDDYKHNLPKAAGLIMNEGSDEVDEDDLLLAKKFFEVDASGRPRTCGWFDAVLLKRACQINGFSALCLNKLDCLSGMKKVKICIGYGPGLGLDSFSERVSPSSEGISPSSERVSPSSEEPEQVQYLELPGWEKDISNLTSWDDLPEEAKTFIITIEELVKVPVLYIGTGRDRDSLIVR